MAKSSRRKVDMSNMLTDEDLVLWRMVTGGDEMLPGKRYLEKGNAKVSVAVSRKLAGEREVKKLHSADRMIIARPSGKGDGLDRRTAIRLRRGQIPIDFELDLHGLNQREAHATLFRTLVAAQSRGERCVLVITGKGSNREGGGVLKTMLPRWLLEPNIRNMILGQQTARPKHGGSGATYVLLRRLR